MPNNIETELKFKVLETNESIWQVFCRSDRIQQLVSEDMWQNTRMEAWYYDTAEQALQKAGIAYRVRREGESWVATVKTNGSSDGGLHQREEWNVPSPDREPKPELFADLPIGETLLAAVNNQSLQPIFATVFDRLAVEVIFDDAQIEIAIDEGNIRSGELSEPIREVEFELKSGQPEALFKLAAVIARDIPMAPEPDSKYYRALLLSGLAERQKPAPLDLPPETPLAEGLSLLMAVAISKLFSTYQKFLSQPDEPYHTHQMRVKLRRLRSLLQFAKPSIAEAEFQTVKQTLNEWGQAFSPLRELDVLTSQWEEVSNSPYITFDGRPWLGEAISKRRTALLDQINHTIKQGCLSADLLELWAWSAGGPWQSGEYPATIGGFARWRIGGWLAALLDAGKTADWQNAQELHGLRLRLKRIRYSMAVMPFYTDRRSLKLLTKMKVMQELFGSIQDQADTAQILGRLSRGATRAVYRDIGLLTGWQGRGEQAAREQLKPQWKKFKRAAQRWLEV